MRSMLLLLLCAACTTTVHDLPAEAASGTLLAGRLVFEGTKVAPTLWLTSDSGRKIILRPRHGAFLVSVPPGTYELRRIGDYEPKDDRLTIEARAGRAIYIGTLQAVRDEGGELRIVVFDEVVEVRARLVERYGDKVAEIESALIHSSLEPLDPGHEGDLVVAVRRVETTHYPTWHFGVGIYHGYYYGHHYGHHYGHRHFRGHGHRGRYYHR